MKLTESKKEVGLTELALFAQKLQSLFQQPQVLLLSGHLGVGKTTFTQLLLKSFIKNPTNEQGTGPRRVARFAGLAESHELRTGPRRVARFAGSPAFSIQHTYGTDRGFIHHVDLYRLEDSDDLESTGFWDIFADREQVYLVILEWANRLNPDCLPLDWNYIKINFLFGQTPQTRNIEIYT